MSGKRYILDTNAIVALLKGNLALVQLLQKADWIGISVISQIEFLVFPGLTESDRQLFGQFLNRVEVMNLVAKDTELIEGIVDLRQRYRLKLPDAIIGAITIQKSASLVTADLAFSKVADLTVTTW